MNKTSMRRCIISLLLIVGIYVCSYSQNIEHTILTIWLADGTDTKISFDKNPVVSFENQIVKVTTTDGIFEFPDNQVTKFTYDESAGINSIYSKDEVKIEGGLIVLDPGAVGVELYDASGKIVPIEIHKVGDSKVISIETLRADVYILKMGKNTYKFIKK